MDFYYILRYGSIESYLKIIVERQKENWFYKIFNF